MKNKALVIIEIQNDPLVIGYSWDETDHRIQPEPIGTRRYIELKAVRKFKEVSLCVH